MQTAFALHQLCHSHNLQLHGMPIDPSFLETDAGNAVRRSPEYRSRLVDSIEVD